MDPISLMFINQHPTSQAKVGRQHKLRRTSSIPIGMSVVLLRGRVDAGSVILQFSGQPGSYWVGHYASNTIFWISILAQ